MCPLLSVGIQGCWSRTHDQRHSLDVLDPVWSSPIPVSSDYVDPTDDIRLDDITHGMILHDKIIQHHNA